MNPKDIVIEVLRICDHCNKEYTCAIIRKDKYPHVGFCKNKVKCPLCGEYDSPWVLIKQMLSRTNLMNKETIIDLIFETQTGTKSTQYVAELIFNHIKELETRNNEIDHTCTGNLIFFELFRDVSTELAQHCVELRDDKSFREIEKEWTAQTYIDIFTGKVENRNEG